MRLGLLKAVPRPWEPEWNLSVFEKYAREAADRGVELLVTCECYLDGYCADMLPAKRRFTGADRERFEAMAQADDSPYLSRLKACCKDLLLSAVFGYSSLAPDGIRNTAILIGQDGNEIGRYHKTHLYEHDLNYVPGDGFPVFQTPWGKAGILICADRRWPEAARSLKRNGAQILIIPTYGMRHEANTCWMRTRAYENECYLAFCHPELSLICSPSGEVEAVLESNVPGLLVHDVDPALAGNAMFSLRRDDIYVTGK